VSGNLFICDYGNHRIRLVTKSTGIITTYAGSGTAGSTGDGGPATIALLSGPTGVAVDVSGNLFICDYGSSRIRLVTKSTGIITTYAGTGTAGTTGDGGPATSALFSWLSSIALDVSGNLFISEQMNKRVRLVTKSTGIITTYAGGGTAISTADDSGPATIAIYFRPEGVALDSSGNLFIVVGNRIRVVTITAACSAGSFLSAETCASCIAGTYNPGTTILGSAACLACPAGQYAALSGASACVLCSAGSFAASGASSCSSCSPGTYASSDGASHWLVPLAQPLARRCHLCVPHACRGRTP
jgi:hypothetical protein